MKFKERTTNLRIRLTNAEREAISRAANQAKSTITVYLTGIIDRNLHAKLTDTRRKTLARKAELSNMTVDEFLGNPIMNKRAAGFNKLDIMDKQPNDGAIPGQRNIEDHI